MKEREGVLARLILMIWLTTMWVLLWEALTFANVVTGLLASGALVLLFPPETTNDEPLVIRPIPALRFGIWFLWALIVSNVKVAAEVVATPSRSQIRAAVVATRLHTRSGRLATIIGHAITLTPGTLTVDARGRPAVLFVHVLSYDDTESVRADVLNLERRVVDAFGTAAERRAICGPGVAEADAGAPTDGTPLDVTDAGGAP